MLQKIGLAIVCIGMAMADSDCLLIPLVTVAIGAALLLFGGADDETA